MNSERLEKAGSPILVNTIIFNWKRIIYGAKNYRITRDKSQNSSQTHAFDFLPSSLPGVNGLFGDVGESIFSRVEAMDGVTGVVGGELT